MGRHSSPGPGDSSGDPYDNERRDDRFDPRYDERYDTRHPDQRDDALDDDYGDEFEDDYEDDYVDDYADDGGYYRSDRPAEDYPPTGEQPLYDPRDRYAAPYRPEPRGAEEPDRYDPRYQGSDRTPPSRPDPRIDPRRPLPEDADDPDARTSRIPAARPTGTTGAHDFSSIDFQGGHRRADSRRGVSLSVIISLAAVVVVVAGVILWRFFGNALSDRTDAASAACVDNTDTVAVVVDPSLTEPARQIAENFNETANGDGGKCVSVEVKSADSDEVISGFVGEWPTTLGDRPALWIPASSISSARLASVAGPDMVGDSTSLLTSPILLAIRPELKPALAAQNWSTVPGLQTNPTALDGLSLPGWGSLRLVLPRNDDSDASYLAAESIAAAAVPAGAPAADGVGAVSTVVGAEPELPDDSTNAALDALLAPGDPAANSVHAVAVTEQQLFARAADLSDAATTLASWQPPGAVAVADYPTVLLKGTWLSEGQQSAASEFVSYLRQPDQLAEFAKLGFQTEGGTPPTSDIVSFAPPTDVLTVGDNSTRVTLANALTAPTSGPSVSIMLDLSMTNDEGGQSRLANAVAALNARLGALPPNSSAGLTTFDGSASATVVTLGPLSEQVNGQPRSDVLRSDLESLSATDGGAVSFTTLRNVYTEALTNFAVGQSNSVLIVTAGPHTDQSLDGTGLEETIRSSLDPARPVAVNVINFGDDPDRPTWEAVAQLTGGTYQNLASSDSPELATALNTMLA